MPSYTKTGKYRMNWLTRGIYDALKEGGLLNPYGLYWIKDQNIIFRGGEPLMDVYAFVDDFPIPYTGDIKPKTLCIKTSDVEGEAFLEARVLKEDYTWETVVPPVYGAITELTEDDKSLPTRYAVKTFVDDRLDVLREYFDALENSMREMLQTAQQASEAAYDASVEAVTAANNAANSSLRAESYAVGGTDTRPGENTDNAKYYKEKAQEAAASASGDEETIAQMKESIEQTADEVERDRQDVVSMKASVEQSEQNASNSASAALTSEQHALASEQAAHTSEVNAKASENAAKTSETNAHNSEVAAKASEDAAALSEQHAATSETNALASEQAAKLSEQAAASSESNAHNSEVAAKASEQAAAGSEATVHADAVAAAESERQAKLSEQAAAQSESNAASSESNAHNSEVAAAASAAAALSSEGKAKTSETNAKASENVAALSETNAHNSEVAAGNSQTAAYNSQVAAAGSAAAALTSEQHALASEQAAAGSASASLTSEQHALASEQAAAGSAANALLSEQHASTSESNASNSASAALTSEQHASASKTAAANSAILAESWAVGGTDTREGEDENNAKYYAELAEHFSPAGKADKPNPLPEENGHLAEVNTEGNLVTSDLKSADVAKKDGYYAAEGLGAATAEQIIDPNATPEVATFGFRTSAGDLSITDGTGVVNTQEGSTEIINQIVAPTNENTVTGDSTVQVTDAVAGVTKDMTLTAPKSVVINQLATATQDTVATGTGVVEVEHSAAANANALKMIAPRSVVVNQLFKDTTGANGWLSTFGSLNVTDGVFTYTVTTVGVSNQNRIEHDFSYIGGHKYVMFGEALTPYAQQLSISGYDGSGVPFSNTSQYTIANTWTAFKVIFTNGASNTRNGDVRIASVSTVDTVVGDVYKYRNLMCIDLTQYFNGDQTLINSITSWDDLVAYDPRFASYVEYNTGTVAGVQPQVKVTGKNLVDAVNRTEGTLPSGSVRPFDMSKYYLGVTQSNNYVPTNIGDFSKTGGTYSFRVGNVSYGVGIPVKVKPNAQYVLSWTGSNCDVIVSAFNSDGVYYGGLSPVSGSTGYKVYNMPLSCTILLVILKRLSTGTTAESLVEVSNIQLELGSVATAYEPYYDGGTTQAPAPLFAVGTAADEYEVVSGVTTRKIGSVDLSTLPWTATSGYWRSTGLVSSIKRPSSNTVAATWVISSTALKVATYNAFGGGSTYVGYMALDAGGVLVINNGSTTNSPTGMLYYELATPTTSQSTPTQISIQSGDNVAMQTDGGRLAILALNYPATVYTKQLGTYRYYLHKHGSTVTQIYNESTPPIVELDGSDQLVDLTQLFNYDGRASSVLTWDDLVAHVPVYSSTMAYNAGVVTGAVPAVKVTGKNLLDQSTHAVGSWSNDIFGATSASGGIDLPAGTYTASIMVNGTLTADRIYLFVNGSAVIIDGTNYKTGKITYTLTRPGKVHIEHYPKFSSLTGVYVQLELGSTATTYEPYFNGGTVTAPSTLYGIYSVLDSFNAVTGKITRNIGAYTFTGNENFTEWNNAFYYTFNDKADCTNVNTDPILIVEFHKAPGASFASSDSSAFSPYLNSKRIYFGNKGCSTVAEFQQYMAGKTIYYELATPTEETSEAQPTSFQNGVNIISQSSTDLPGVSISAKYDGINYNLKLINGYKYIVIDNGTTTYITASNSNNTLPVVGGQTQVINLTQWFGKGYEPTLDNFYKRYPSLKGYTMSYTPGQVLNYRGTGIRTVGFNAYNSATGTAVLLGGNEYQICGTYTSVSYVDRWGNTEELDLDEEGIFTPVNDGTLTVTGGNATDTCVHLTWSGYKNYGKEEYKWEPYWQVTTELPVATYFPDGMNGIRFNNGGENIADVYDELTITGYVKRVDKADLSTLTWTWKTTTDGGYWKSSSIGSVIKRPRTSAILPHIICTTYRNHISGQWGGSSSYEGYITVDSGAGELRVNNGSTTITPTGILYYELATPVTVTFPEAVRVSYPISDFGTEELLPAYVASGLPTTTWLDGKIQYEQDFTRLLINYSKIYSVVKHLADTADHLVYDDSTAPNLTSGNAYNLIDRNAAGTERQFSFDPSGGAQDITDGTAIAKKLMGTTLNLNQLVHDTNENTVNSVDGNATVTDAVKGNVKHLVVSGDTVVVNQLVHEYVEKTESGTGRIWIKDAFEKEAKGLKVTAPRSVVMNQFAPAQEDGTYTHNSVTYVWNNGLITISGIADATDTGAVYQLTPIFYPVSGHYYVFKAPDAGVRWRLASTQNSGKYMNLTIGAVFRYTVFSDATHPFVINFLTTSGETYSGTGYIQLVDLTQYFNGNQTLIDSIQTWDDLVAYDPSFASYVTYNTGTVKGVTPALTLNGAAQPFATAPQEMFGVVNYYYTQPGAGGLISDTYDVLAGSITRKVGYVDLSTLTWTYNSEESWHVASAPSGMKMPTNVNYCNFMCSNYMAIPRHDNLAVGTCFTNYSMLYVNTGSSTVTPTGMLYYELATPVVPDVTPVAFDLVSHDNTIFQTSGDLQSTIEATYDGLNQTITLDPTHTYIVNHQYVSDSIITNESSIDVIGTEDNLVDLTQLYNGDSTRISAIHSWASLSSKIHMYRDWLPYIPGEIVNLAATIRVYQHEYAYGVLYDPSKSSPACQKVELHDGVLTQVEEFSSLPVHDKFYRCVMDDLSTRHIAYYLDDTDSTKKYNGTRNGVTSDGSASVLTGADGDVMVEMPITHWSIDEDYNGEGKILWLISDQPFTGSEIHPYFYVSPNGDTPRVQYVGAYRAVGCDENGNALNTTEGAITQTAGTVSTRLLRSVAGALPWVSNTLASMRTDAVRHGGTMVNRLFHEYLFLIMSIEQATLNCQSISMGYSNGKTNALWAWRKSGRANYGNGTGEILATSGTTDDDNFYSLKVNNVQLYRDVDRDANNYYAWSNHAATVTVYWTASATPVNGDTAYSDTEGTSSGYTVASWSTTADANKIIQFQYRGIENPWGEVWEFDDGVQKYQKCMLTVIRVNNILHYVNHLKDGTGTKTAWTSEDGTSTYWTTIAAPGNNSIAYSDSACTIDSGYKTTQVTFINVDCEMWESLSVNDYTSTDQHTTVTKLYNKRRYYWPRGSWIKKFDPRSFLPRTTGGNGSTYLCDNWSNDNGTGSRVVYRGGNVGNGANAGLGYVFVYNGLAYSYVYLSGRLSA